MTRRGIAIIVVVAIVAVLFAMRFLGGGESSADGFYEFATVERGDLENVISATGTLSAVGTVEVGTQVSGTIAAVLTDFNDRVTKGQVLAVLDTTMLSASVRDAGAALAVAEARYDQAEKTWERTKVMHGRDHSSDVELEDAETALLSARGSLLSARAMLDRSRTNLGYATIRSPIDGTVIQRNVEEGQTVAASFSTPTLFVIAEDLTEMEILALVDESDIGQIVDGQHARFTVEAHYEEEFEGEVRQIRLQPETVQNVVTYTVVVDAPNERGLLLPGMTATIDFFVEERSDVLLVPNTAIRFRPTADMMAELRSSMEERIANLPEDEQETARARMAARAGASGGATGFGAGAGGPSPSGGSGESTALLWYLNEEGAARAARVTTGATDGIVTEIVDGRGIVEGTEVITAVSESAEEGGSSNPLVTGPFGRRRR